MTLYFTAAGLGFSARTRGVTAGNTSDSTGRSYVGLPAPIAENDWAASVSRRHERTAKADAPRAEGLVDLVEHSTSRRTRWSSEPPVAETASGAGPARSSSRRASARA